MPTSPQANLVAAPPHQDPAAIVADVESRARRFETPCGEGTMVWHAWGEGPPLVLLHGSHGSWSHWIRNVDALGRHRTLWVPDLPFHGDSAGAANEEHDGLSDALATGLRRLVGNELLADIVGFSFGGVVAAHLAAFHPDVARRVVVIGSGGLDTPLGDIRLRKFRHLSGAERAEVIRANLLGLMLHHPESADDLAVHLQEINTARARFEPRMLVLPDRLIQALPKIAAPIGAIWGSDDLPHPVPELQAEVMRHYRPDLHFRVVQDAGHWVMYERPEAFNLTLIELLDAMPG